jgi:hypothetical protein
MSKEKTYKVGDELAFMIGYCSGTYEIHKITKISPTGRITCGRFTLDPDLNVRGRSFYGGPYRGQEVTDDIRVNVMRRLCIEFLSRCDWVTFSAADLARFVAMVKETAVELKEER